jgi:hypothetical protein
MRKVMLKTNLKGKYDDNNLVEGDREHLIKGDWFEDTEVMNDEDTEETRDEDSNDEEEKTVGKQPHEQQAETDPGEHLAKGDELEDGSEDTSRIVEKKVEQDEAFTHWENVKEERSREEEAFDNDDRGEDDREFFNKEEGFEDTDEYEAGIKVHQDRELIRDGKPETRDGMLNMYKKAETRAAHPAGPPTHCSRASSEGGQGHHQGGQEAKASSTGGDE